MKTNIQLIRAILLVLAITLSNFASFSQCYDCLETDITTFYVDLSSTPDTIWTSPEVARNGLCCGNTSTACIRFIVYLNSGADEFSFSLAGGAVPPGMSYQVDCGTPVSAGEPLCVAGADSLCIVYCKPGGNINSYQLSTARNVNASQDIVISSGCSGLLTIEGIQESTVSWFSVFPGLVGDYNSYLSCLTGCDSVYVTPQANYPQYIDFVAQGNPTGCSSTTTSDTVRVYFVEGMTVEILPINPAICYGGSNTTITASAVNGAPPYSYLWNTGQTTQSISVGVGTYWVQVSDTTAGCPGSGDTVTVVAHSSPIVANAGADQVVCINNPDVLLSGTVTQATGGVWSGGTGTFSPDSASLTCTYTPSASEIAAGSLTLSLTTTGNGGCPPVTDNITISILPDPVVNAGIDQIVCAGNPNVALSGSVTIGGSAGQWTSSGSGSFIPNSTSLNATYIPTASDISLGSVTITLASTDGCSSISDNMLVTITPAPIVSAGPDQSVCSNNANVSLAGSVTIGGSAGQWTTSGSGTFTPSISTLNATYIPDPADISGGAIILTLTSTDGCAPVQDQLAVIFTPSPVVNAGADVTICADANQVLLSGSVSGGATTGQWFSSGSGTFSPGNTSLNASYIPSPGDIITGSVSLSLSSTNNGNCTSVTDELIITIVPAPIVDAGADQSVCANNPAATLNGSVSGGGTTGIWTSSGSGTFTPDNVTLGATYIPSTADTSSGTVILTLTATDGCSPVSDQLTLTFTDAPYVFAGPDQIVCFSSPDVNLSGIVSGATNTGQWSSSGGGSFIPDNISMTASYQPDAADISAGSVTLILESTNNGSCLLVADTLQVTISNEPIVNAGNDQTVCANNAEVVVNGSVTGGATEGIWNTSGDGVFLPSATSLNATYQPGSIDISSGNVTLALTATNGCSPVFDEIIVTITAPPSVQAGPDITICDNNSAVMVSGVVSGGASTGSWTSTGGGAFSPSPDDLNATYTPDGTDILNGSFTLSLTSTGNGNCLAVSDDMAVNVIYAPVVAAGPDQTVCANNADIDLNGVISGFTTSGQWTSSGTGTFNPSSDQTTTTYLPNATDISNGSVLLTLTSTNNNVCLPVSDNVLVTINPAPVVDAGPDQTVCANNADITLNGTVSVLGAGTWSTSGDGYFSPDSTFLSAVYYPGPIDTANQGVVLTLVSVDNGSCIPVSDSLDITITTAPFASAGQDIFICVGSMAAPLNGSVWGATNTGIWSSSGTGTFSPDNISLNTTYNLSPADTAAGMVTIVLETTNNGSCLPETDTTNIYVTTVPVVEAGPNQTVCANNSIVNLTGTVAGGGGTGLWTSSGTGVFIPDNTQLNAQYIMSSEDTLSGTVVLYLQPTFACSNVSDSLVITITDAPIVVAGPDQTLCNSNPLVVLNGSVSGGASSGIWSTTGTGSFSPDETDLNATYTASANDIANGFVDLILSSTNNGNCLTVSDTISVSVLYAPTVDAGSDVTVCANYPQVQLSGSVSGISTTGIWSTSGSGVFTPSATTLNATYIPDATDIINGGVTLTLSSTNNLICSPVSSSILITITEAPVTNAGSDQVVCANNSTISLSGSVTVSGTGIWTTSGDGIFTPNNTDLNAEYTPGQLDINNGTVYISLTSSNNGNCLSEYDVATMTITPAPAVNAGPDQYICIGDMFANLNGSVTGGASTGTWTSTGSGTFSPDNTTLSTTYNFSPADTLNGYVQLVLESSNNGNCNAVTDTLTVTITSLPFVDAGADQSVCANNATVSLSGVINGAGSIIEWSSTGTGTFSPDNFSLSASYTPSPEDILLGQVSLSLRPLDACGNIKDSILVTITEAPVVIAGPDIVTCDDSPDVLLTGSISGGASTGQWSSSGTGSFFPDNFSLNSTYTSSTTDMIGGQVFLTLTSTNNGNCLPESDNMKIDYVYAANVFAGLDQVVCANNSDIPLSGSITGITNTGQWSSSGSGSFVPDISTLNATYIPSAADTSLGGVTLTLTSTNNNICNAVTDQMNVVITDAPYVNAGPDQVLCSNNANASLNGVVTLTGTGIWTTSGDGNFSPSQFNLDATYIPGPNDLLSGSTNIQLTSTGNVACLPESDLLTLTFTPSPLVDAGSDIYICEGTTLASLSGVVSGGASTGIWSTLGTGLFIPDENTLNASYIVSPEDEANGFVTLVLTSTLNGDCLQESDTLVIYITPLPTSTAGSDQTVCANNANINLNGVITGGSGTGIWSTTGDGSFNPSPENLNAVYIPGPADTASGSVELILEATQACAYVSDMLLVTITPAPFVFAGPDMTICNNDPNFQLNGIVGAGATNGLWTSSGSGTYSPDNATLSTTYIPSLEDIASGIIVLALTSQNNGSCIAVSDSMTASFIVTPVVDAGPDQIVCANNIISLNGDVFGGSGTGLWSTPDGTGIFSPSSDNLNAEYQFSTSDTSAGTLTFILSSTNNGNCNADTDQMIVTVTPAPIVNAGVDQTVCANNASISLNGNVAVTNSGIWSSSGDGVFTPDNTDLNGIYTPGTNDISLGSANLLLSSTNNGGCLQESGSITITITPAPVVNAGTDIYLCEGTMTANLSGAVSAGATTAQWTSSGTGSFSPDNTSLTTNYNLSTADTSAGSVLLILESTSNGNCNPENDSLDIFVTPIPTVSAGSDQTVCANNAEVQLNGQISDGTGLWSTDGDGIFSPSINDITAVYIPGPSDTANGSVTLILEVFPACTYVADTMTITITPAPYVNAGPDQIICNNNSDVQLTGIVSAGASEGIWTSTGIGLFSPDNTALNTTYSPDLQDMAYGQISMVLTSTNNGTCIAISDTAQISFIITPVADAGPDQVVCANNTIQLNGAVYGGMGTGIWSTPDGTGSFTSSPDNLTSTYIMSPADTMAGSITFALFTTNNGNCPADVDITNIAITPAPYVFAGVDRIVCANNSELQLSGSITVTNSGVWTTSGDGSFYPTNTNLLTYYIPGEDDISAGSVTVLLTSTNNGSCYAESDEITIFITDPPLVNAGPDQYICEGTMTVPLAGNVSQGALSGQWNTLGSGTFSPTSDILNPIYYLSQGDTSNNSISIVLESTNNGNCLAEQDTVVIHITPLPVVNAGPDIEVCANNSLTTLFGTIEGGSGTGIWTTPDGNGVFSPSPTSLSSLYTPDNSDAAAGTIMLLLTATNACPNITDTMNLTITPAPVVSAGADVIVCDFASDISLNGSISGGASTGYWSTTGTGNFSADSSQLNAIYTPSPEDINNGNVTLTLTSADNGNCLAVSDQMSVSIITTPTADAGEDLTVCANTFLQLEGIISGGMGTGIWYTPNGTGTFIPNNSSLNATYLFSPSDTTNGSVDLFLIATGVGNCTPDSDTLTVSIIPAPLVNAGPDQVVCANNPAVSLYGSVSQINAGQWSTMGDGVFSPSSNALNTTYLPGPNDILAGGVTLTLTSSGYADCNEVTDIMVVTITPAPIVNAGNDIYLCEGTMTTNLSGSVSQGASQGQWTTMGSGSFIPDEFSLNATYNLSSADTSAGSVVFILESINNGTCLAVYDTVLLQITTIPTVSAGTDQLVCANNSEITLSGIITGGSGNGIWSSNGDGIFLPDAYALNASYLPGNLDTATGSVTISLEATQACTAVNDIINITITQSPYVFAGSDQIVCDFAPAVSLNGIIGAGASVGEWSSSGDGTFSDITAHDAIYTPGASDIFNGNVVLTLTSVDNGDCFAVSDAMLVQIVPTPTANAGIDMDVCANTFVDLSGEINGGTGNGIWYSPDGTGSFSPSNTDLGGLYLFSPADTINGTVTFILISESVGSCSADYDTMIVTVTPAPTVEAGPNQIVCSNNSTVDLNGAVTLTSTGIWSTVGDGIFVPTPLDLDASYIPGYNDLLNQSVILTLSSTNNGDCLPASDHVTISFTPSPAVYAGNDIYLCEGTNTAQLEASITGGATAGLWTSSGSGTFSPSATNLHAVYELSPQDVADGNITLFLQSTDNGNCLAEWDTINIYVTPVPSVEAGTDQMVCANNNIVYLEGLITGGSGTGVWSSSGDGIFAPYDDDLNAVYVPGPGDSIGSIITITLEATQACTNISDILTVEITSPPIVNAGEDQVVCYDNPDVALNGSISGATTTGVWTTDGDGTFIPDNTTLNATYVPSSIDIANGVVVLHLTTTNNGNCIEEADEMTINIVAPAIVDAGPDFSVCANTDVQFGGNITNGMGTGIWTTINGTGTFDSETDLSATYQFSDQDTTLPYLTFVLTSTNNGNCTESSDTVMVVITPAPKPDAGMDQVVCANNAGVNLNATVGITDAGTWFTLGDGAFIPNNSSLTTTYVPGAEDLINGLVVLYIESANNGDCNAEYDSLMVQITPAPEVNAGNDIYLCEGNTIASLSGSISGGASQGMWQTMGTGAFIPDNTTLNGEYYLSDSDTTAGLVELILESTDNGNCLSVSDTTIIYITTIPTVDAGPDQSHCANNLGVFLNAAITGGSGNGVWTPLNGDGYFLPDSTALNAQYFPGTQDINNGGVVMILEATQSCLEVSDTVFIEILPAPFVNAGPDLVTCYDDPVAILNGVISGGASTGTWLSSGTGTFTPSNLSLNAQYVPSSEDITSGQLTLTLTSTNNGNCLAVTDSLILNIIQPAVADAGTDQSVCANSNVYLAGSVTSGMGTGSWSTPDGTGMFLSDIEDMNAVYQFSPADTSSGSVTFILTSTNNGNCVPGSDTIHVSIIPAAVSNAGADQTVCGNNAEVTMLGSVSSGNAYWHSAGDGTFSPDTNSLYVIYSPGQNDIDSGMATILLTTIDTGLCPDYSDTLQIIITPMPQPDIGPDIFICEGETTASLSASINGGATGVHWQTLGTGIFLPSDTVLNPTYQLSIADTMIGSVVLIATSTGNGDCFAVTDSLTIFISEKPVLDAGADQIVCSNTEVVLSGSVLGSDGIWSSTGTGAFFPDENDLSATYIPSPADTANGLVYLILTSTQSCETISDSLLINFTPAPYAYAGPDQLICSSNQVNISGVLYGATGGYWTSSGTGTFISDSSVLTNTYMLSQSDLDSSLIQLVLITTGNGTCNPVTDTLTLNLESVPLALFYNDIACNGQSIAFIDSSQVFADSIVSWNWDFGNGDTDTTQNPTYLYSGTGTQTVTLIITTESGCTDTLSRPVNVHSTPYAEFSYVQSCITDSVFLSDGSYISEGSIVSWIWDLGDTLISSQNSSALLSADTTVVFFSVVSDSGCTASVTDTLTLPPSGSLGFDFSVSCNSTIVQFNDTSVFPGNIDTWNWTFEGGATSNIENPTFDFESYGTFNVWLSIETAEGCTDSVSGVVNLEEISFAGFTTTAECQNNTILFTDTSMLENDTVVVWSWNFGDGQSSMDQHPQHSYMQQGVYDVTLIVQTANNCDDSLTTSVATLEIPAADFSISPQTPTVISDIQFTDNSTGAVWWYWDFGDNMGVSEDQNPEYSYNLSGNYMSTLFVMSADSCLDSVSVVVSISGEGPVVIPNAFSPNDDNLNDVLYVRGGPFKEFEFRIFNEWGNQIFMSNNQETGWDGTVKGKKQPAGVYTFVFIGTTINNDDVRKAGDVTLIY